MNDLEELERERGNNEYMDAKTGIAAANRFTDCGAWTASNEMCTFLVMNISSLQLIPMNIIAYRSQYGSANPAAVTATAIVVMSFSTVVAVIYCKAMGSTVNARFYVYPSKKKSDILYLVTDNPRTIVYNYFYTS